MWQNYHPVPSLNGAELDRHDHARSARDLWLVIAPVCEAARKVTEGM
jgi:hypothetical protein